MKRYLLTGVALLCMGLEASNNPFDLKSNLKNLDEEQSSLISELRESSSSDEFLLDEELDADQETDSTEKDNLEVVQPSDQNASPSQAIKKAILTEEPSVEETAKEDKARTAEPSVVTPPKESAGETLPETLDEERKKSEELKPDKTAESLDQIMAEEEKKAEEARLKALEEERIAVEKYEAERLRKKQVQEAAAKPKTEIKETPIATIETEKTQEAEEKQIEVEEAMEQAKKEVEQSQPQPTVTAENEKPEQKSILDDIDLTEEQKQAKEAADRLYLEAVKEVNAE